jgi:two-component system sensor histidine kinase VicK
VVQNILSNSVKYTPDEGVIDLHLGLTPDRKAVLLVIKDTGFGIPKDQQEQIFTKLFRADNVREKETEGTGLGLYIAKTIIDNSGGKLWFESEEDKGTTFYLELQAINSEAHNA